MTQSMTVTPPTKSAAIVCAIIVVIVSFMFFRAELLHAGVPQAHTSGRTMSFKLNHGFPFGGHLGRNIALVRPASVL
jgi:hypothetical protein